MKVLGFYFKLVMWVGVVVKDFLLMIVFLGFVFIFKIGVKFMLIFIVLSFFVIIFVIVLVVFGLEVFLIIFVWGMIVNGGLNCCM